MADPEGNRFCVIDIQALSRLRPASGKRPHGRPYGRFAIAILVTRGEPMPTAMS